MKNTMIPVTTVEQIDRLEAHVKDGGGLSEFGLLSLLSNYRKTIIARDAAETNYLEMVAERDAVIAERDAAIAERDAPVAQKARPTAARARA